jgi:hypothetical protein
MIDLTLQTLGFIAAVVVFWRAESILNLMAPGCRLLVRLAFWLLVVGAAAFAVRIWQGYTPPAGAALAFMGMALLLVSERRVRAILRIHTPIKHERRAEP